MKDTIKILKYTYLTAGIITGIFLIGVSIIFAAPSVNILGNRAVVGTGLYATTTANAHLTASGTIAFVSLGSSGNPCLTIGTDGTIATSTCGSGIISWGGSTSSTQTYATSGSALSISTLNGVHTFSLPTSTASITGVLTGTDWTTFNNKLGTTWTANVNAGNYNLTGLNLLTATSATIGTINITSLAESPFVVGGTATTTIYGNGSESTFGGGISATYASSSNANFVNTTTTNLYFTDNTKQTTAFKDIGFNVFNATTTATATTTIQRQFYQAITLTQIDCSTNGANITIGSDERASSTPDTLGTDVFNGGSLVCDSNGNSTSTFANATIAANALLNFDLDSAANATTTLRVYIKYKND